MSIRARAHGPELQCFAKFVSVPYHFKLNVSRRFLFSLIWVVALWHLIKGRRYHDIVYRQGLFIVSSAPMSPSTKFLDPREQLLPFAVVKMPLAEPQDVRSKPSPKFPLNVAPESWRPYMELIRLEKPTGTKLMFWPFTWGVTMALYSSNPTISPSEYSRKLLMCLVWAFIMRSSACTVNDIFDRHMDAGVERCKNRPLPSGRISVAAASIYLAVQYVIGGLVFYLTLDGIAFHVALFQLLPLFAIYPLLKRFTHWPQAWLGFAMNFGFITGWVSVTGHLDYNVLLFAIIACWCWTMIYDTIYACQDVIDDLKTGVHSTAILFGTWILPLLAGCACIFVTALFVVGCLNHHGPAYFIVSVGGTALHLVWQFKTVRLESPESCWENFNRNGQLGWIVWAGLLADFSLKAGSLNAILAAVA